VHCTRKRQSASTGRRNTENKKGYGATVEQICNETERHYWKLELTNSSTFRSSGNPELFKATTTITMLV